MKTDLVVTGIGMITPVGLTANACMHSVRSSITRLTVRPWPDRINNWLVGGRILTWVPYGREKRLQFLAELAFTQAWSRANANSDISRSGPTALLLGVPEATRPGYRFPAPAFDVPGWFAQRGVSSVGPCEVLTYGACNAQVALQRANQILQSGVAGSCVIGVADTQWHIRITRWHEDNYRLKCGYLTDGLMPSEAACFLVVEKAQTARTRGANILAQIGSVTVSRETATILSDQPNTAKGLTDVVRASLLDARLAAKEVGTVWSDLNGESYRAREWAFTEIRCGFQTHTQLMHPADCHGDLGAASDANLLGLAVMAQASGWAEGKPSLVFSGSEGGVRAATIVAPATGRTPVFQVSNRLPRVFADNFDLPKLGPDEEDYKDSEDPPRVYFEWQLRQEHLEEMASIYNQRKGILSGSEIPWYRAREPEQRILNHLDAAAAGGAKSLWAVASGIMGEDEGNCFAGALVLGVLPSPRNLAQLRGLLNDPSKVNLAGIQAGLMHAPSHPSLHNFIITLLDHEVPEVKIMAIYLAGYRREVVPEKLMFLARTTESRAAVAAVNAIRRMRILESIPLVEHLTESDDQPVQFSALLAALLMGSHLARLKCRALLEAVENGSEGFAGYLLSLCGNFSDLPLLLRAVDKPSPHPKCIEAIGILGNVQSVPHLIRLLQSSNESIIKEVAEALELITGAGLREKTIIHEHIDLLGGEFEEVEREIEQLSVSPKSWIDWWNQHSHRFDARARWRRGSVFSLGICVDEIRDGGSTMKNRQRAYWELVLLSRHDIPFEPDWFVARQEETLSQWQVWLRDSVKK